MAVRRHLDKPEEVKHPQGTVYERGKFSGVDGRPWDIALLEIGAGNPGAALETERAINFFHPSILLFVGVAGGIKDVALCDVVAATKVYGYESGEAQTTFQVRPSVGESSYSLVQRARMEARKENWLTRVQNLPGDIRPRVHIAPIAAGEKVVVSRRSDIYRFLRTTYGDAVAVEMEGRGFLQAVYANQQVSALIVRGISDLISGKGKADKAGYQEMAAGLAAAFALEVLANLESPAPEETGVYVLVLSATISEIDKARAEAIVSHLREISKDARLTLIRIEEGSVKLVLEGSLDGFERLESLAETGDLSTELSIEVIGLRWLETRPHSDPATEEMHARIEQEISEAKAGSRDAINRLFEAVHPYLTRIAQRFLLRVSPRAGWMDAEDLVLDCLYRVYKNIDKFRGTTAKEFLAWLNILVRHEAMSAMRMKMVYKHAPMADVYLDPADAGVNMLESAERMELVQSLEHAIANLSEPERLIIRLRYFDNLSIHEIALQLDMTAGSVRSRLHRATKKLLRQLATGV